MQQSLCHHCVRRIAIRSGQDDYDRPGAMSIIIATGQRKGGVGKTTLAVSIAAELTLRGFDIGLVDADSQRSACQWAEPGHLGFEVYEASLAHKSVEEWVTLVRQMRHKYLVIDCPPQDRDLGVAAALAQIMVVPCMPSSLDIEATIQTLAIVRAAQMRRAGAPTAILVPNRVNPQTLEGQNISEELKSFEVEVAPEIGDRTAFVRSFATGQAVLDYEPGGPADREIRRLADLLITHLSTQ